jgi:hypothetical protein
MIEEDFYATIKLKSGEEIFAKVAASEEEDRTLLILSNPIVITEVTTRFGFGGYKVEPWIKTSKEDMYIINFDDVLTISESSDIEIIIMYQSYVRESQNGSSKKDRKTNISKKMGYISSVNDAKEILEKLYRNS